MFGVVKMFARVAAWTIAACFLVSPAQTRDDTGVLAEASTSAAIEATATPVTAQFPTEIEPHEDIVSQPKTAILEAAEPPIRTADPSEPFGLKALPWFSGDVFDKWTGVESNIRAEKETLARCRKTITTCPPSAQKFLAIVAAGSAQTGRARIGAINRAVNFAIQATSDLKQWGVVEHWSSPLETFTSGRGDCEDYAIAKYVALMEAGVAPEDVRLVIVRDAVVNGGHAVAAARLSGRWIVLDNRWLALAEDGALHRLVPEFVIDETGVKAYVGTPSKAAPVLASLGLPSAN